MAFINIISINSCIPSLLLILLVSAQTKPQPALVSPCPSVFEYDTSIQHPGRWYGVIKLSSDYTIHSLWLNIHLDDNYSEAFKNCLGSVTQENKYEFMINRTDFVINPGEVKKVQIYVEYNITSSPPKMIGIAFNGRRICGPSFVLSLLHSDYRYHGTDMRGCPYRPSALPPSSEEETSSNPTYNIQSTTDSGVVSNPTNKTENKDVDDLFGGPVSFALPDTVNNFHNKSERSRCGRIYAKSPLVIGEAIETIHWPWQVLILRSISAHTYHMTDFKYRCSGTLVSTRHVITAAHCLTVRGQLIERDFEFIDAGRHQLRVNEDRIFGVIKDIKIHPEFDYQTFRNDLSIVEAAYRIKYSTWVQPACLWPQTPVPEKHRAKTGVVGGWGFDQSGEPNELLTTIEMSEVDTQSCLQAHDASLANYLTDKVYCAKYVNGTSNCHKDSGGGMMVRVKNKWYLRGVLSFYYSPELQHACQSHALFTDVAKHLPWIKQHVYDFL
ncbi:CLIP domain-containing serine protease B4 isoform X1 [Bombyx mori]|uniref:Peptidase S1 domain-containing protein n=1 Tax=Bombyx mori TaxID=7091 RepID=A0A8R2M2A0_BOMMO|nr:CLIP domain-containing serine protease 14D isoform X1 [Bombyx mori]